MPSSAFFATFAFFTVFAFAHALNFSSCGSDSFETFDTFGVFKTFESDFSVVLEVVLAAAFFETGSFACFSGFAGDSAIFFTADIDDEALYSADAVFPD